MDTSGDLVLDIKEFTKLVTGKDGLFPTMTDKQVKKLFDEIDGTKSGGVSYAEFDAWCNGMTGYPVVDAGMRQLVQTGFMHNRARMICASFLVKDLLVDWRWGERFFFHHLTDADPAQNAGNWQWVAGTGVDSNMFVRIMAPLSQSEKFDAAGYIREYVPELADLDEPYIHDPEEHGVRPSSYPAKIIAHKEGRERALAAYRDMKAQS